MLIVHTREGHRSDMADVHAHKQKSGVIGSDGPMGRILIRGSPGHDIIPELYPAEGAEPIIDKPGKVCTNAWWWWRRRMRAAENETDDCP